MDFFVINLDSEPVRLRRFLDANRCTGIDFKRFQAIDGKTLNDQGKLSEIVTPDANYSRSAIGAALSHLGLWRECLRQNRPIAVFEDDAQLRADILEQLTVIDDMDIGWDFLLLGCNTDSVMEVVYAPGINFAGQFSVLNPSEAQLDAIRDAKGPVSLLRLKMAFGGCGYLLTPKGAAALAANCFPMDARDLRLWPTDVVIPSYGIDCMMVGVYPQIEAYTCFPPLANSRNLATDRTV